MADGQNRHGQPIGPPVDGWLPRPLPTGAPMTGHYCRLERLDAERHAGDLFDAWSQAPDDRDWTYLFAERPVSVAACRVWLAESAASRDPMHFAIVGASGGPALGTAALMRMEPAHGVIEVGAITYSPSLMKTAAGTEAMYLMMRRSFDELGYRRYEWKCDALNAPSRRAALRYGFRFEGVFRQAVVYKGRNRDTAWYAIVDAEWPRLRDAFERWLEPGNFDEAGRQRQSLAALRGDDTPASLVNASLTSTSHLPLAGPQ